MLVDGCCWTLPWNLHESPWIHVFVWPASQRFSIYLGIKTRDQHTELSSPGLRRSCVCRTAAVLSHGQRWMATYVIYPKNNRKSPQIWTFWEHTPKNPRELGSPTSWRFNLGTGCLTTLTLKNLCDAWCVFMVWFRGRSKEETRVLTIICFLLISFSPKPSLGVIVEVPTS